jgi:hypothetical protein
MPQRIFRVFCEEAPNPLHQKGDVHNFGIRGAKTTLVLWLAYFSPINPMLFAFISHSSQKNLCLSILLDMYSLLLVFPRSIRGSLHIAHTCTCIGLWPPL